MNTSRFALLRKLRGKGVAPSQMATLFQVRKALGGCDSALDVGCGPDSALSLLGFPRLVGIEGYAPDVEKARANQTHHDLVLGDVRCLDQYFRPGQFDACVALDVIEHLPKEDGIKLAQAMERIARRKVLFLTPNGFLPQRHAERADLQAHISGWEPAEMERLGYKVQGVLGPKSLRGEYHRLKYTPESFWGVVSLLGHFLFTRWAPAKAAAILCVKSK